MMALSLVRLLMTCVLYSIDFRYVGKLVNASYMCIQSLIKSDDFFLLLTTTGDVEILLLSEIKSSLIWPLHSLDEESDLAPIICTDKLPPDKRAE